MKKTKALLLRHKQLLLYFLFGFVTTVCSLVACYITLRIGVLFPYFKGSDGRPTELLDIIGSTVQWITGVLVAFFTNKFFVFTDAPGGLGEGLKQFGSFTLSRVGTYLLEVVVNLAAIALIDSLGYRGITLAAGSFATVLSSRFWAKAISSVLVVIANYLISKFFVFKKK